MWISFRCKSGGLVDHFWVQFNSYTLFVSKWYLIGVESVPNWCLIFTELQDEINEKMCSEIILKTVHLDKNGTKAALFWCPFSAFLVPF